MKVQNVSAARLRGIVERISTEQYDGHLMFNREPEQRGKWLHFTLRTVTGHSPGARRTHQGRRLAKACWHAHRDVMARLFDVYPCAVLHTMLAEYDGRESFLAKFPATGESNIGSIAQPLSLCNACEC